MVCLIKLCRPGRYIDKPECRVLYISVGDLSPTSTNSGITLGFVGATRNLSVGPTSSLLSLSDSPTRPDLNHFQLFLKCKDMLLC